MAGGALKGFGALFSILGIVVLLVGVIAAGFGYMDQQDHQEDWGPGGVAEDSDRTQMNEALILGGAAGAVVGLVMTIVSIVFFVGGGIRAQKATDRLVKEGLAAGTQPASRLSESDPGAPQTVAGTTGRRIPALAIAGVILVVAILVAASIGIAYRGNEAPRELETYSWTGSLGPTLVIAGQTSAQSSTEFTSPFGATSLEATLMWDPAADSTQSLHWVVEVEMAGQWETVYDADVQPGVLFTMESMGLGDSTLRSTVRPVDTGFVQGQSYDLSVTFY